jgi:hypothetical protein
MVMVKRPRPAQPGLFDVPVLQRAVTALQAANALELLGILLTEALADRVDGAAAKPQEVGDDESHG